MDPIFTFSSYKAYLSAYLDSQEKSWGLRSKICKAMGIHNAYLSQVLQGPKHLNLENLEKLADYLELSESEMDYLITLAEQNRSGTKTLQKYFDKKLETLRAANLNLVERIGKKEHISEKDQAIYYSSWHFAALHVALLVPKFATISALAQRFKLSESKVRETLETLMAMSLVQKTAAGFEPTSKWVRLPKTSPLITQHHSNIRLKATEALHEHRKEELHYSGFLTFSESDFLVIQELWMKALKETQEIIGPSESENVFAICLDVFQI